MNAAPDPVDPDLLRTAADTVAVLGAAGDDTVIWHVDVGPATGLPRLCGSWRLGPDRAEQIAALVTGRHVLAVDGEVPASAAVLGRVEPAATVAAVAADIERLQTEFDAEDRKLVAPDWPEVPTPPEDPAAVAPAGADPEVAAVLGTARWLRAVAEAWAKVESQRLARPFLVDHGGAEPRTLPLA